MKIKSLLLGSAAVLVAVSGARAADAIVVEPEPVEYVRVCDAYGSGWFYIPGTETCLKIDGDVRVQYDVYHYHDEVADETSLHDADYRARFNLRANNETEYGTLTSRARFSAEGGNNTGYPGQKLPTGAAVSAPYGHDDQISITEGPGNAGVVIDKAFITLAGFSIGYDEDYWTQAGGYGFYQARYDGVYGYNRALYVQYTYAANGFAATIGAQDGEASGEAGAPDVYGGLTYTSGGFYMAGIYMYDTSEEAGAWKVRADYDFGNGWKFGALYASDNGDTDYVKGHVWGVTGQWQMTETMLLFAGYGNYDDQYSGCESYKGGSFPGKNGCATPYNVVPVEVGQDYTTFGLAWTPVSGLLIQPEYNWVSYDSSDDEAELSGFGRFSLRVVRSF
jgi:hypothetical protein